MKKLNNQSLFNRYFIILIITLLSTKVSFSQDIIKTKDGKDIEAKVLKIDIDVITYKNYNYLDGPEFSISKNDITKIEFENGMSQIFAKEQKVYKKDPTLEKYRVENSKKYVLWDYQFDIDKVISSPTIYYYGLDMSNLILVNGKKSYQDQELRYYIPAWVQKFEEEKFSSQKKVVKEFHKENAFLVQDQIQNEDRYNLVDENWIRSETRDISIEQVKDIVKSLTKSINEKEGIGFIMIMDNFFKPDNKVRGICTFFDISSGELLWATRVEGGAGDKGMTRHWGFGIVRMFNIYYSYVYKPLVKDRQ